MIWLPVTHTLASPLIKVPLLVAATARTAQAMTPPNPPLGPENMKLYDGLGDSMKHAMVCSGYVHKGLYWANVIAESAVIIAEHFRSPRTFVPHPQVQASLPEAESKHATHNIRTRPWWSAGCALMYAGSAIRPASHHALGKLFTWELTVRNDHVLVTGGSYAVVRHPSFVGMAMLSVGLVLCHFSPGGYFAECVGWDTFASKAFTVFWGGWILLIPTFLMTRVNTEDEVLRREFGKQWESYAERTPYKLIPYVY
ncbi:uncharacterized protein PHACADRAFT_128237 [Phanerochaete carnosa HHB-10118-sp]|uniref:Protein-S-isoprenylcysteine O-methyltransferase n=1 Tax=Phanerochaete carnosa (strain HHB-10118-sp) TaxID=650164 RepID=K5VZ08_PHACS|nr:uncharacterized protein PHACADRAFT_128237 [Phanerochaete carnosa HHB-10118-sp]EKM52080.1 hypothetical protein PHACADRAFT_128237 [Phanerochaete carnosa HHB-10118-sp]